MSDQTNNKEKSNQNKLYKSQNMNLSENNKNTSSEREHNDHLEYVKYMEYIEYLSKQKEEELFQEILKERRRLYALGLYELEEGEILK